MALELFKPFVMKRLVDLEYAQNIKSAKRMVERARPQVWDVLEEVIKEHPVFLNRAPTLHRLGIQAFEPVLVEGKAIQIHPLVCAAFNADFDGDQMAVHLPLSSEAQAEARLLMLSAHNILSPAHGRPITVPSQDMIIGAYYLTELVEGADGEGRRFASLEEARMAHELRDPATSKPELSLHARIKVRLPAGRFPADRFAAREIWDDSAGEWKPNPDAGISPVLRRAGSNGDSTVLAETTLGRMLFNEAFPSDFAFTDFLVKKRDVTVLVGDLVDLYTKAEVATSLDKLKELGFEYSTRAGLTISISDVRTPVAKAAILDMHEKDAEKVEQQYDRGIITDDERRQKEIEIWTDATNQVTEAMQKELIAEQFNPIEMMVGSGARGNVMQVRQIAGMRGLVANPRGEIIPRPIKSNFREGLSVLEYFISTHGARKGLADTALRTADSGYLTRRLVDVAQELIVRDGDCGIGPWHLGRGRPRRPRARPPAREPAAQPVPLGRREARRRYDDAPQHRDRRRRAGDADRGPGRHPRAGAFRAHLRVPPGPRRRRLGRPGRELGHGGRGRRGHRQVPRRRLQPLLRHDARDRQARRPRRSGRHHRRPVDR